VLRHPLTNSSEVNELPGDSNVRKDYRRIGSPEVEALFNPGTTALDGAKCAPICNQIDRLIWHEPHSVILYAWACAVAVRANLANSGAFGFADADCLNAGFAL
jgi:peptide/nickel transport system substrate-binding protein